MATTNLSPLLLLHSHSSSLSISKHKHRIRSSSLRCSASSNGSGPTDKESERRQLEEKRRAELAARIASGEFTVQESGWVSFVRNLQGLFSNLTGESGTKKGQQIPKARGSISSVGGQAFFLPLYELFLTYGGIFRLIFGPKSFLIVSDPAIAKHILRDNSKAYSKGILAEILDFVMGTGLIPADGEIWRVRRRAIVPALHQKYVAAMISLFGNASFRLCEKLNKAAQEGENAEMESLFSRLTLDVIGKAVFNYNFDSLTYEAALSIFRQSWKEAFQNRIIMYVAAMISLFGNASFRLCEKLDKAAQEGEDVEMESLFSRLTLDVIGKAVFNYDFDSLTYDNGIVEAVYTVLREAEMRSTSPIPVWEIPIWKDISPRQRKVNQALKLINDILDELIAICKRMVDQEDLQFHEEYMNEQDPSILHFLLASGDDVSSKQLRDDLMTMLIAGHETSAAVLTWTFYLLSKDPQVVAKLQEEADTVIGDRFPTIDDMKKLKYTTRVINESLRLYPQPPVLIRRSIEDDVLGGYPIGRGEDIFISIWNLHRCPKNWTDADKFNPERWPLDGPNPNETNQNFSYLPFGGGPRKCVGDMFATFEVVVATAMLMRRFNFQMAPNAPPVEMTTGATIHTTEGLNMTVTHRTRPVIIPNLEAKIISDDRSDGSDRSASQEDQVTAQI